MDMVLVGFHYVNAEIGTMFDDREYLFDDFLHCAFKQPFPILADEDEVALQIPFVTSTGMIGVVHVVNNEKIRRTFCSADRFLEIDIVLIFCDRTDR